MMRRVSIVVVMVGLMVMSLAMGYAIGILQAMRDSLYVPVSFVPLFLTLKACGMVLFLGGVSLWLVARLELHRRTT